MAQLRSSLGCPRADLLIEKSDKSPPDEYIGGVALTITLWPREPFTVRRGRLELVLSTTQFSRTTLDGFREHTSERVWGTVELFDNAPAQPGVALVKLTELLLPEAPTPDSRPVRMQWRARVRFDIAGFREFSAALSLRDVTPHEGGAPTVDGAGFLPLYEFRTSPDS